MLAVEVPYMNIYIHKGCWKMVKDDVRKFLEGFLDID